jgi:hypothetical protein
MSEEAIIVCGLVILALSAVAALGACVWELSPISRKAISRWSGRLKSKPKHLLWGLLGIAGLLWAVYVWPTPWSHYKQGSMNLRVNRFTGKTQHLAPSGWRN